MSLFQRLHPLDLALGAVALLGIVVLLVTVPGYRWSRDVSSGLLQPVLVTLTMEVSDPLRMPIARELATGALTVETVRGEGLVEIVAVQIVDDAVRLVVNLDAARDRSGRTFWNDLRLRRGEGFRLSGRDWTVHGAITALTIAER